MQSIEALPAAGGCRPCPAPAGTCRAPAAPAAPLAARCCSGTRASGGPARPACVPQTRRPVAPNSHRVGGGGEGRGNRRGLEGKPSARLHCTPLQRHSTAPPPHHHPPTHPPTHHHHPPTHRSLPTTPCPPAQLPPCQAPCQAAVPAAGCWPPTACARAGGSPRRAGWAPGRCSVGGKGRAGVGCV